MRWFVAVLSAAVLSGCGRSGPNPDVTPPDLEVWMSIEVPSPAEPEFVMLRNGSFASVASKIYGHRNFAGFLAVANGVPDPDLVLADAVYQSPGLTAPFEDSRLNQRCRAAVHVLAVAATELNETVLPEYLEVRRAAEGQPGEQGRIDLSESLRERLFLCADQIDSAAHVLSEPGGELDLPTSTVRQFHGAAEYLRGLATGVIDGYGYDYDMVGQRMGLGFTYLLIWAFEE